MFDVHSHIVYGIDDGPETMEESLRMLSEAEKLGIKVIVATPHLRDNTLDIQVLEENFRNLLIKSAEYGIILELGCEAQIHPDTVSMYKDKKVLTLAGSKHILIEFPFTQTPLYTYDILYRLQQEGITAVIAHPERYSYFVNDFGYFSKFLETGCLAQLDASSIIGKNGSQAKNFCKKVIKRKAAHFIASDAHCAEHYKDWYMKSMKKVRQWAGEEYTQELYFKNAKNILDGMVRAEKL